MQSRLIVKNFGPLKDIDVELKNVNVFIGPQASGKSALAKLFTIFKAPRKFLKDFDKDSAKDKSEVYFKAFKDKLDEYNIGSFLNEETEIEFDSALHNLCYKKNTIIYEPKLLLKVQELERLKNNFIENSNKIHLLLNEFKEVLVFFDIELFDILKIDNKKNVLEYDFSDIQKINENQFLESIDALIRAESILSTNTSLYIPAERNFINIIKNASLNLLNNNVPIPKHILSFGAELEKAVIEEIDLNFLQKDLLYKSINGEDRIFTNKEHSIKLTEAASGIQSVLPILIPILHKKNLSRHQSFVIEEPELNLFPTAQYELVKVLESSRTESIWEDYGTIHNYTTHSPYILSALNNLLYAHKVETSFYTKDILEKKSFKVKISNIVSAKINPNYFTAYQLFNGKAQSIFNEETGLIDENFIDEASDKIGDDFDALMELMSQYKHAVK
jgi:predicted ATPase